MKIQKIEKLNNARFRNYTWGVSLSEFSDGLNILFGWNGSGKTTLSRFLRSIEKANLDHGCTFKIKLDSGAITESENLTEVATKLRVFNDAYVEETLRGSTTLPYIFFCRKGCGRLL